LAGLGWRLHADPLLTMELALEQLATHIPDIVLQRPHIDNPPQTIDSCGVVVFADISGILANYIIAKHYNFIS